MVLPLTYCVKIHAFHECVYLAPDALSLHLQDDKIVGIHKMNALRLIAFTWLHVDIDDFVPGKYPFKHQLETLRVKSLHALMKCKSRCIDRNE